MSSRVIGSGQWDMDGGGTFTTTMFPSTKPIIHQITSPRQPQHNIWKVGQIVDVRPRTWAGINRLGGTGRITKIHYNTQDNIGSVPLVTGLDVKYSIYSGHDFNLDPDLVQPHKDLESRGRRRCAIVKPVSEPENSNPNVNHGQCKGMKATIAKKHAQIGAKKGSASKPKRSLSRSIGIPHVRSKFHSVGKTIASPSFPSKESSPNSSIPKEIVFNTTTVANTPTSDCSKSAPDLDKYSPLGNEGVENQLVTTASYDLMVQTQRPSVGTSNAACPSSRNHQFRSENDDDLNAFQLQISTTSEDNIELLGSFVSATPLATGRFGKESKFSFQDAPQANIRFTKFETCNNFVDPISFEQKDFDRKKATVDGFASLRNIYDQEVIKASQFIEGIMQDDANACEHPKKEVSIEISRLNKFRSLLNDYLFDSDGMIEVENLGYNLSKFASSKLDQTFDFTECDVESFLTELCAQNKIMLTEGWIYNI